MISESDVRWHYSTKDGPLAAQPDPNQSLGKFCSSTEWVGGLVNDLFDDVSGLEASSATSDHRCVFARNAHPTETMRTVRLFVEAQRAGGATVTLGKDSTAPSPYTSGGQQAVPVAAETTAPALVTFAAAATEATGVACPDIPPGYVLGVWLKRAAANQAMNLDWATVRLTCDTPE